MDLGPPVILVVEIGKREAAAFADNKRQCEIVAKALNHLGEAEAWCLPRVKSFPEVIQSDDPEAVDR
jgi:hypothetical protein